MELITGIPDLSIEPPATFRPLFGINTGRIYVFGFCVVLGSLVAAAVYYAHHLWRVKCSRGFVKRDWMGLVKYIPGKFTNIRRRVQTFIASDYQQLLAGWSMGFYLCILLACGPQFYDGVGIWAAVPSIRGGVFEVGSKATGGEAVLSVFAVTIGYLVVLAVVRRYFPKGNGHTRIVHGLMESNEKLREELNHAYEELHTLREEYRKLMVIKKSKSSPSSPNN
jgi:hypothetical protein